MLEFIKVLLEITTVSDIVRTKHIFYLQYIVTVILCCVVIARSVDLLGHFNSFFFMEIHAFITKSIHYIEGTKEGTAYGRKTLRFA